MNAADTHTPFEELAAGYALDALEPGEEKRFVDHLGSCAPCARAVATHRETLGHLAYAAAAEPPAALWGSIRASVGSSGRPVTFPGEEPPVVADLGAARSRRRSGMVLKGAPLWLTAAAAVAVVVSLGMWNTSLRDGARQNDAWQRQVTQVVQDLGLTSATKVRLSAVGDGKPLVLAVVKGRDVSLVVDGLAPNDRGSVYVLWQKTRFGDLAPVGSFDVARPDLVVVPNLSLRQNTADVVSLMVTRERGRSAPALPAAPVLAAGNL